MFAFVLAALMTTGGVAAITRADTSRGRLHDFFTAEYKTCRAPESYID